MARIILWCFFGLFYNFDPRREPFLYCLEQKLPQNSCQICTSELSEDRLCRPRYKGHEHAEIEAVFVKRSHVQTQRPCTLPLPQTHIHKFSHTQIALLMYSLWSVRVCLLSLKALNTSMFASRCMNVSFKRKSVYEPFHCDCICIRYLGPQKCFRKFVSYKYCNRAESKMSRWADSHGFDGSVLLNTKT